MGSHLDIPHLTVERSERDGVQVVALSGELDLRATGELDAALAAAGDDTPICLDLTALQFVDSTGLATVIRAHQARAARGVGLAVVCRSEGGVRRTFETTGLVRMLTVVQSRDAALQALG